MTTTSLHPLAGQYVERLRRAAGRVPRARRDDLVAEIEAHLADAIAPGASDAEALEVLGRLGTPEEIIDAEAPAAAAAPVPARGRREWAAIFLLLFGGVFAGIGWVVGLVFLWGSNAWTTREKWIGTLVVPGGLALPVFALLIALDSADFCLEVSDGREQCAADGAGDTLAWIALTLVALVVPFVTAVFLARRAGRRAARG